MKDCAYDDVRVAVAVADVELASDFVERRESWKRVSVMILS